MKETMIEIFSGILIICAIILYFIFESLPYTSRTILYTFLGAVVVGSVSLSVIFILRSTKKKDINWAMKKAAKILKKQQIRSKNKYWQVRYILFKHKKEEPLISKWYMEIKEMDLQAEDLTDKFRMILNETKAKGDNSILSQEFINCARIENCTLKERYQDALMLWGVEKKKTPKGVVYYDLTNYMPFE